MLCTEHKPTTWDTSTLRAYLNGEFYDGFTDNQKEAIVEVENTTPDNEEYDSSGGFATTDHVFLLTIEDATKYFPTDDDRRGMMQLPESNPGAASNGKYNGWFLRTAGCTQVEVAIVAWGGSTSSYGTAVETVLGVRPAMWVSF